MLTTEESATQTGNPSAAEVRLQLQRLVLDDGLRSSRRSVAFLRYIVDECLAGRADELKERTIGVHVFGRPLTYDTNLDHVVRTAASELRKRLTIYYGRDEHRDQLRIALVPGSYVPQFQPPRTVDAEQGTAEYIPELPAVTGDPEPLEPEAPAPGRPGWTRTHSFWLAAGLIAVSVPLVLVSALRSGPPDTARQLFWRPLLEGSGPVLIAMGDVPHGPPVEALAPNAASPGPPAVPFANAEALGRIGSVLGAAGKTFVVRRESASSFADLRERPAVLLGAFNNEWSLRMTRSLRFSFALDPERHLIYIRDRDHPDARAWSWSTEPHPGERNRSNATPLHDYALISRVLNSETGHDVLMLGGLYAYGTQAAGEFVASPEPLPLPRELLLDSRHQVLQIVLETTVTDGSAGPPRVVAVAADVRAQ